MTYTLWIEPPQDIAQALGKIIAELAAKHDCPVFTPHITLYSGMTHTEDEVIRAVDLLVGKLFSIEIKPQNIECLDMFYRSMFIRVKETPTLMSAYHEAEQVLKPLCDKALGKFMPHLSLMYSALKQNQKEAIINQMKMDYSHQFLAQKVALYETVGLPHTWRLVKSWQLVKSI